MLAVPAKKEEKKEIPHHIGIIMDGNRRWAKERNLPAYEGHSRGFLKLKQVPDWFFRQGVKLLSFYCFSTENWQREAQEVNYLMKIMADALNSHLSDFQARGYRLFISGRVEELPGDLPELCAEAARATKDGRSGTINLCLNSGGRAEIVDALKKILKNDIQPDQIHEGLIKKYLYHGDLPDPDLIIRTSGEQRLSGFLLWQSVYSELFFLKKYWPDFEESDVELALAEYSRRQRRFGGNGQ